MSELPEISYNPLLRLSPDERASIRSILESPLWIKYMSVAAKYKPSPFCALAGAEQRDAFSNDRANARLGELRGWISHEKANFVALMEPAELKKFTEESYPDEGRLPLTDKPGTAPNNL